MTWWQIILVCWFCYVAGFATSALMVAASDRVLPEDYKAGLNDD